MAVFKLIVFLAISMAFVLTVRCQQQQEFEYVDADVQQPVDQDTTTNTTEPGKKGFANCVKEKVKKVVDKGKQVLKAAGDAISKGYNDFKTKAKEIIGKKQPETYGSSTPSDISPPSSQFPDSFPSSSPNQPLPPNEPSGIPSGQQNSRDSQSTIDDQAEYIDPRQKFTK